jgi:hypothetical protein
MQSRAEQGYAFGRDLTYDGIVAASERVAWTVDAVFAARAFDATQPMVPWSWVGAGALVFLGEYERLVLNHCRAFSYVHLIGNLEAMVPLHLAGMVREVGAADRAQVRALLRFGDEERKHRNLFARAERVLEDSCGHSFGRHFDPAQKVVTALVEAMLERRPLARYLIALALELGTQRHYVESVREATDPLYADILKAHWVEEAQHVECDVLEIARLAGTMGDGEIERACDDVAVMGALCDAVFVAQTDKEIETLVHVTGRVFSGGETAALRHALHASLAQNVAGAGLGHPEFAAVVRELSPRGAARLGLSAAA